MVNMTNQQARRKERHRFRVYFRSLAKVAPEVFYRKTANDLKSACMRSAISDAVLIARAIHKRDNRQQHHNNSSSSSSTTRKQDDRQQQESCSSKNNSSTGETSEQRFIRIFVTPFSALCSSSDEQQQQITGNSPLQVAAYAGAASVVHFILSCYILFLLQEDCFTEESHTVMAWMHKVGVHQQHHDTISSKNNDSHTTRSCWREELILTMVGSSFHYLYERKYTLSELLQFVTPYLVPYTRLEQFVGSLATKIKHLGTTTLPVGGLDGPLHAHSILDDSDDGEDFCCPKITNKVASSMPDLCALEQEEEEDSGVLVDVPAVLSFVGSLGESDDDDDDDDDFALVQEDLDDDVEWEVVSEDDSSVLSF